MVSKDLRLIFFVALGLFFLYAPQSADAALLYFDPAQAEVYRGDTVTLKLRLDTEEGECINTVDAVINYDAGIRAVDVSRGNSILNVWLEEPVIDESAKTIKFAAGIPGGYCGRIAGDPSLTNVLVELVFRSPGVSIGGGSKPEARVWVDEGSQVLLNDGNGTNAPVRLQDSLISLLSTPGSSPSDSWKNEVQDDKDLPADFAITLAKDDSAFSGEYFIVFNSSDKQSGIDHYEAMEEPFSEFEAFKWGRADAPWVETQSPYVLKDQTLNSTIRVKAIDKAGNERIVTLVPDAALRSMSRDTLITLSMIGTIALLLIVLAAYALWKRRQRLLEEFRDEEEPKLT
jgi:hypothetical protein